jgi:hypothetical protein
LAACARRLDFDDEQRAQLPRDFAVPNLAQFQVWLEA